MSKLDASAPVIWVSRVVLVLLAIGLTNLSPGYVRTADCSPNGACRPQAGFPLPFLQDGPNGGSPIDGWGRLDAGDWPNPFTFGLNVLFYSVLLRLLWRMLPLTRSKEKVRALRAMVPMLVLVLLCLIMGFLSYRPVPT